MDSTPVVAALQRALQQAATTLPTDVQRRLEQARQHESSPMAEAQLDAILENVTIARTDGVPMCQDTGIQTFFVKAGVGSPFLGDLEASIRTAVALATAAIPLRPNTVDPFTGENPGNNTGRFVPIIHWELVAGDDIQITLLPKGGGSENACALKMLPPNDGLAGIKRTVLNHMASCRGLPCPPTLVGLGIGGGADIAMILGKKAVLRAIGSHHPHPKAAALERELLELLNSLGIGPMGVGGTTTCLAVHVEYAHRHPASLPLGIVVQCWANRRARVCLHADGTAEVIG